MGARAWGQSEKEKKKRQQSKAPREAKKEEMLSPFLVGEKREARIDAEVTPHRQFFTPREQERRILRCYYRVHTHTIELPAYAHNFPERPSSSLPHTHTVVGFCNECTPGMRLSPNGREREREREGEGEREREREREKLQNSF